MTLHKFQKFFILSLSLLISTAWANHTALANAETGESKPHQVIEKSKIFGVWQTQKKSRNARIQIQQCQDNPQHLCGKIIWLEEPKNAQGEDKKDINNQDPKLRHKPLMGLDMLKNFEMEDTDHYINGTIYNPEDGDTYQSNLSLDDQDTLTVRGYVGIPLFGKSQTWKRVK